MARPVTGCHCRSCRKHGRDKNQHWRAMRRATKKALNNGTEPPKTVSYGFGGAGFNADVKKYDNYILYD